MSTWSQRVSLQFTCILSHLSSNITCKCWKKLHQDKTSKTYQILFVQLVGKTTCCFIVVSFKELRKARNLKPTHGVGSRRWRVVRMRYCFFYSSVSGITHRPGDGEGWKKERKHVLLSSVGKMVWKVQFKGRRRALGPCRREALQGILPSLV